MSLDSEKKVFSMITPDTCGESAEAIIHRQAQSLTILGKLLAAYRQTAPPMD